VVGGVTAPGALGVVGLLHTVPALAARFDADLDAAAPGLRRVHVVEIGRASCRERV
jgi:hypothetical protein